ncbi:alpha/beta fold hydrolase [Virgibacillus halophilus]|uniref:alpha/beta fold hydrolase n=1 Tax=Tigheibacillus halophilus TaxID=361280 RepID=UPI00362AC5CB
MERKIGTYTINGQTIEYSITGKGEIPILVMHGGHSNCYEEFGYAPLMKRGCTIITPSRAGYGSTSKKIGESLSAACEIYVKLLNYLGIGKVHLLSISAGGPSGIYFASHYPERVKTLTLQSAITKEWYRPKDKIYQMAQILFHPYLERMTWKLTSSMSNCFPKFMFKQLASSFSNLPYKKIKEKMLESDMEEIRRMNNRQRSGHGFLIDLSQTKEITAKDLHAITCPTLIIHSRHDGVVSLEHAHYAHQEIPDTRLCVLDTWGHLIWLGKASEDADVKFAEFLIYYARSDK